MECHSQHNIYIYTIYFAMEFLVLLRKSRLIELIRYVLIKDTKHYFPVYWRVAGLGLGVSAPWQQCPHWLAR